MDFQDAGCTSGYYSEVPVRALWGFFNNLRLPAAPKYRCVPVYFPLMFRIDAHKYSMENKPNTGVLQRHRQVAFPHPSSVLEVHSDWHLHASTPPKGNCLCTLGASRVRT